MLKKVILIFLSVILLLLSGCADRKEIDDYAYVIAAGIDKADGGKYKFTVSLANVNAIGETKGGSGNMANISAVAADFYSALDIVNNNISKKINLSHTKLIIFSADAAREGIKNFTDSFVRELKIRPETIVAVSENCGDYLENLSPVLEINPEKYFKEIFETDNTNYSVRSYLSDFFYSSNGADKTMVLPVLGVMSKNALENPDNSLSENPLGENDFDVDKIPIKAKNKAMISGIAYFSGDKMIDEGSLHENIYHLLMTKSAKKTAYSIMTDGEVLAVSLSEFRKPEINVKCGENPKIGINLFLDCETVYLPDKVSEKLGSDGLEKFVSEDLKKNLRSYLSKTSTFLKTDTENFSRYAKRNFLTQKAWDEYGWAEKYKNAEFDVNVEVNVAKFGVLKDNINDSKK